MTNEQRALWKQSWSEAHMQEGLKELHRRAKISGKPERLEPGYDALVLAASAHHFAQGQNNILDALEELGNQVKEVKPLDSSKQFQATPEYLETRR